MFDFVGSIPLGIFLMLAGFILAGVEMFLPGFSVPGIIAAVCLIAGITMCANTVLQALALVALTAVVLTVMFVIIARRFASGKMKTPIQLKEASDGLSGRDLSDMLGSCGVALTDLHPVGTADFVGEELEVSSTGKFIPAGTEVVVTKAEMNRLTVKPVGDIGR